MADVVSRSDAFPAARPAPVCQHRLSVILPVLDEERRIGLRLAELRALPPDTQILVVDGGSQDRTAAIARDAGATVLSAPRGRGSQMNFGARRATGEVLLFLHADVSLPPDAAAWVERALAAPAAVAGAFRTRTVDDLVREPDGSRAPRRRWIRPFLRLADLRSRYTRLPYGDQAMFVRSEAFERVGGFPESPLFEDLELSRRLRCVGRIVTVSAEVRVSGRRFTRNPLRSVLVANLFLLLYRCGVRPEVLARFYGPVR